MVEKTKIRGLEVEFDEGHLRIKQSYVITNKNKMNLILDEIKDKIILVGFMRDRKSLIKEWKANNRLNTILLGDNKYRNCDFRNDLNIFTKIKIAILGF